LIWRREAYGKEATQAFGKGAAEYRALAEEIINGKTSPALACGPESEDTAECKGSADQVNDGKIESVLTCGAESQGGAEYGALAEEMSGGGKSWPSKERYEPADFCHEAEG